MILNNLIKIISWKNWSFWLRGGVLAVLLFCIIYILLVKLTIISFGIPGVGAMGGIIFGIINFFLLIPGLVLFTLSEGSLSSGIVFYGSSILTYFLIGALIGLIIGKIKSKKEK